MAFYDVEIKWKTRVEIAVEEGTKLALSTEEDLVKLRASDILSSELLHGPDGLCAGSYTVTKIV